MSASDSGTLWDLRCLVREQMILFVQEHYPESLPFLRTDYRDGRGEPELPEVGDSQ